MTDSDIQKLNDCITAIASGDVSALDEIFRMLGGRMTSLAFSFVKNRATAEEIVQDAFVAIVENASKFKKGTNGFSWIMKIVQNLSLNKLRYDKRRDAYDIDELYWLSDGNLSVNGTDTAIMLKTALSGLDPNKRKLIVLKYYYGKTVREIAKLLKSSKSKVQREIDKAEEELKKMLE